MKGARADGRLLLLAALVLLAGALLPWVGLRPNRIAAPEFQSLSPVLRAAAVALAALVAASGVRPAWAWLPGTTSLVGGVAALGALTSAAVANAGPLARASASSGVWVWLLGAAVALYAAHAGARGRARWLVWVWALPVLALLLGGHLGAWSVLVEGRTEGERWTAEVAQHARLVLTALGVALLLGGPLAVWAGTSSARGGAVLGVAGALQTVPSLALLGLLIAPLAWLAAHVPALRAAGVSGIGVAPALVALTLYALLPVLRNGVVALRGVDVGALDAARGMGMTPAQVFWRVQLPLALPVWLAGVRQATVLLVGVASVAALIGAGGLGVYIFRGLQGGAADLILLGAVPAALLAVLADAALRGVERLLAGRMRSET
ncbi:ABC transporter permease [Deinococcus maricopensis]|uniref:ABC-type transporter, integral membrane subunit n=1 Tax=Deinococcus maricopensis (strain DSM 21211 / LMG 22137 / NRRL B-23946 / LB-34) TaxID=709986 RepID=E8U6K4_DEIML|nr:ABC transporter permease [Deinococcus maricopensis]ADV66693.1 ABC-type transporter, integral membrane subunit [Deinococcus maricopensis DSM 21211]